MPMRDVSYQGEGHSHALFLGHMSFRVDLSCLCSSLHSQQILFPDMLLWSLAEWSLWTECLNGAATHFDLERYSRLWADRRCGRSRLAFSETIHVPLWVKVSPEMDQGQNSTRVGRNHLSRDILPFWCPYLAYRFLWEPSRVGFLVSAVVLRLYWNIQVWTFSTTEVILLQVTNDEFLGCRLCFSLFSHLYSGKKGYFMSRCLVMELSSVPGKDPRSQKNTE